MIEWKPGKAHFDYLRSRPYIRLPSNTSYLIEKHGDVLYICFEETSGCTKQAQADDWAANLNFFPKKFDVFPGSKIRAHDGLARQYLEVRQEILDLLYSGKYKQIYVGGFSQGAGLTTACVQDIGFRIDRDKLNIEVLGISYSGPRFFSLWKAGLIKKAVKNRLLTIKGRWDPVVYVPFKRMPTFFTFRWSPFKLRLCWPRLTFWGDYGKVTWIGKILRPFPLQHDPAQVGKNLLDKYGC
ncbi:MAG: hypothetical protein FWH12_06395 [Treponema sp.]|nr:hypothetical protein [Treponema sp.]